MKIKYYFFLVLFAIFLGGGQSAYAGDVINIRITEYTETLTVNALHEGNYKVFTLTKPNRLVVDVPAIGDLHSVKLPRSYKGRLIKSIRSAQFNSKTTRFVFDLHTSVRVREVNDSSKSKLLIAITPGKHSKKVITKKALKPKKPVIVIDAGHGGQDPGTTGPRGTREKTIVLQYAKTLKSKLLATKKYKVKLTRTNDRYIRLRDRVAIARRAGGDIFISLHADAARNKKTRGLSVYTVSDKASDQEAEALAARENKSDIIGGMDLSEERKDVADILISLAQRETKNSSALLADFLVTRLDDKVRLLRNSHRFAGFAVLKAPDIPSVLIEIGFLSNSTEEKTIRSKSHREKVTDGIVNGIKAYFAKQKADRN